VQPVMVGQRKKGILELARTVLECRRGSSRIGLALMQRRTTLMPGWRAVCRLTA
jgi:hypothetical protein